MDMGVMEGWVGVGGWRRSGNIENEKAKQGEKEKEVVKEKG